jgi:hypothetical protein
VREERLLLAAGAEIGPHAESAENAVQDFETTPAVPLQGETGRLRHADEFREASLGEAAAAAESGDALSEGLPCGRFRPTISIPSPSSACVASP